MKIEFDPYDQQDLCRAHALCEVISFGRVMSPHLLEVLDQLSASYVGATPAAAASDDAPPPPPPVAPEPEKAPPPPPPPAVPEDSPEAAGDTTPPPPPPVDGEELDTDGVPWDPQLHAASKAKTKNGKWRRRRATKSKQAKKPPQRVAPEAGADVEQDWPAVLNAFGRARDMGKLDEFKSALELAGIEPRTLKQNPDLYGTAIDIFEDEVCEK